MYLDIEGDPGRNFNYLIGLLIVDGETINDYSFGADSEQDEKNILDQFLTVISRYADYRILHYGSYEPASLKRMGKNLDERKKKMIDQALNKFIDVFSIVHTGIYLPTYSNSLKDIAKCLGFKWTSENASGIQSIVWRKKWDITKENNLKQKIIQYNLEDCWALRRVSEFIYKISYSSSAGALTGLEVAEAQSVVQEGYYRLKKQVFFNSDFEYINEHSYFDYQREKVFIRTNKNLKRIQIRNKRKAARVNSVNKRILVEAKQCPRCGNDHLYSHRYSNNKDVLDLKFSPGGVKKWVVRYFVFEYKCKKCQRSFVPTSYKSIKQ